MLTISQVERFAKAIQPTVPVLCGAAAWGAYVDIPLHTEDLDFFVSLSRSEIHDALLTATTECMAEPEVAKALAVLDAVAAIHGEWRWVKDVEDEARADIHQRVRKAEEAEPVVPRKFGMALRITPGETGWRVQVN